MRYVAMLMLLLNVRGELSAQVTLEALNGGTWGTQLTLPQVQTMTFRWRWDATTPISNAAWQMSFDATAATSRNPTIVQTGQVPVPASQSYGSFQVLASAIPSGAPSTFYVRVRTPIGFSSWVPVMVTSRTASSQPPTTQSSPIKPPTNQPPTNSTTSPGLPDFICIIEGQRPISGGTATMLDGRQYTVPGEPLPPPFSIVVRVTNRGPKAATLTLAIGSYVDGVPDIKRLVEAPLAAGVTETFTVPSTGAGPWEIDKPNEVLARATLDPAFAVAEGSEANNVCATRFQLIPQGSRP